MSRSINKHAVRKDKTGHKWYNRIIRRCTRQIVKDIKNLKDPLDYNIPKAKELINDYDICDYIIYYSRLDRFWQKLFGYTDSELEDKIKCMKRK